MRKKKYFNEDATISGLYNSIKQRTKNTKNDISSWPKEKFITWYKNQKKECCYCGCSLAELKEFNHRKDTINKRNQTRGNSLEVDRFDDNLGYSENNCCLACYWCNNAKTDTFTKEDMKLIGKAIGSIIKSRLKNKS